jgi:hypothetical protein
MESPLKQAVKPVGMDNTTETRLLPLRCSKFYEFDILRGTKYFEATIICGVLVPCTFHLTPGSFPKKELLVEELKLLRI